MKKYLFILLLTIAGYGQTYQNPTFGTVTSKTNVEDNSAEKILVQNSLGKFNWIYKNSLTPDNFTKVVYINNNNPNGATIFDLNNPPVTNDNLLKSDVNNLYIGTDASTWVYNVSAYVTKAIPAVASIFYNAGTTTLATNTTAPITRDGKVGFGASNPIGKVDIFTGTSGISTGIASLPSGTISFANINNTKQSPAISGKSTTAVGLTLISATNDSNYFPDMLFNVRKSDNTDFATITSIAYQFGRFGNTLMSILRNGNVGINVIPTTTATDKLQVNGNITANAGTTANHVVIKSQLDLKADIASPTFTGNPTAPTPTAGDNDTSIATTAFVTSAIATAVVTARPYKVYTAILTQTGTSAPTAIVLENTTNATITWTRGAAGDYHAAPSIGAFFTANKTAVFVNRGATSTNNDVSTGWVWSSSSDVRILTYNNGVLTDSCLSAGTVEIRVYP